MIEGKQTNLGYKSHDQKEKTSEIQKRFCNEKVFACSTCSWCIRGSKITITYRAFKCTGYPDIPKAKCTL